MFKKMFLLTLVLGLASVTLALETVADFTFDDANSLDAFTQIGVPTVVDGQLLLDGSSWLEIIDPLAGATANYVVEAIVTATSFGTDDPNAPVFDFAFARNDPAGPKDGNNGQGVLFADNGVGPGQISGLNSFKAFIPSDIQIALDEPTAVAVVVEDGTTSLYVNGILAASKAAGISGVPTTLGIGTHPFDGALGAFNGSIDRVRLSTMDPNAFSADMLIVPGRGTVADFTFDDANSLDVFTQIGTPMVVDGQLLLDGSSWLEIADPLAGATANYVVEAIVTATSFGTDDPNAPVFDFAFARNDPNGPKGGNNGQGVLFSDAGVGPGQINALNSFVAFISSDIHIVLDEPTAVAVVVEDGTTSLYINGVMAASKEAGISGVPTTLGIGTHPFDGALGAFNGSIDRVRLSTMDPNAFQASGLLVP